MSFLGVYKALYAYAPQSAEELAIDENDILYLLETSDVDDWWTVKKRVVGADAEEPVGLVPSNYIEPADFIGSASALFDYDRQTEEELTFKEGDKFQVYDDKDPDWILVNKNNQEFGFVPSNYIEMSLGGASTSAVAPPPSHPAQDQHQAPPQQPQQPISSFQPPPQRYDSPKAVEPQQPPKQPSTSSYAPPPQAQSQSQHSRDKSYDDYSDEEESAPPPKPSRPSNSNTSLPPPPAAQPEDEDGDDQLYTWAISEVDGRKKKKAMLAIGNSTIYFSPDSNNGTPHQWKAKDLLSFSSEKKHVFMEFKNPLYSLEIHSGTKEVAAEILSILGELKGSFTSGGLKEIQAAASSKPSSKSLPYAKKTGKILYDFEAQGDDELTVHEGDNVYIINDKKSKDWWMVELINSGRNGVVPAQFVQPDQQESGLSSLTSKFKRSKSKENLSTTSPSKREQHQQKKLQGPKASRIRTWEDASGTFKVDAEFLGVVEGKIHLHKTNGVKIAVAATKLSITDLEYVEKVTGMSLEQYKGNNKKSSSGAGVVSANDPDRERRERRERERRRREREDRERDRAERERDRRERELEREERDRLRQELKAAKTGEISAAAPPPQPARPGSTSRSASASKQRTAASAPKEDYDWFEFFLEAGVDVNQCQRYTNNFNNEQIDPSIMESIDSSVLRTLGLREGDIIRVNRYLDQKFNRQPKQAEQAQGGLFTEPTGGLKANRTGSATSVGNTLPAPTGSAAPATANTDDDAWTVKPAANSETVNGTEGPASSLSQNFTGSMQDLVNLKPLAPTATASSTRSNQTFAPVPSKPLQPTKAVPSTGVSTDTITTQKTGNENFISTQPTGQLLAPLDPFKTGGANILPLATGGAFVYLPTQQTGVLNLQPTGLIPLQKTGGLPFQTTGALPLQQTGLLPLQKTGGNVTGGALPLQKTGPLGGLPQFGTGVGGIGSSLPPTTSFGQTPNFGSIPNTSFGQLPNTSFSSQPTGGLNQFQPSGGFQSQPTGGLNNFQPTGGLNNFQPTGGLNNFQPTGGFQSQPSTGFTTPFSQPTGGFNTQQTGFGQPSFNQAQPSGFNSLSSPPTFNRQQTGFGQPQFGAQQPFGQQPFNQQLNQMTNSFQNTSLQNPSPFGQPQPQPQPSFGGFPPQQPQPQPSFGGFQQQQPTTSFGGFQQQSQPLQPLESQPTGFGFGNSGGFGQQQQPLGAQATGKRANLANASADNPFGF
ncbi:Actin cytoskeleton-regulatory complex protein [Wickerhamomyces ciferrii]|uniref:Actin cytoskeleton-regulatory complex protein SLA1 n=1 Tax=Wickerhamomyces ciferrii (strain ATCC 14091 / BCRC 22168 / CBS 111 / JCM 3599 / NBRC 0793 / NRRL Y-1031 F-60-10) TaxID=1206466 RepID=K0KV20_WICCF|nr:Actin cytoskeleton-regulatory complex protein [Wickerhamomyces ciferrii]CCH47086.1 Actin cytoskeleton-regulatory complex protein [Wickerhamomyces ciferrii]